MKQPKEKLPGFIYELQWFDDINQEWIPFYVGRTEDKDRRLYQHRGDARRGTEAVKYDYIREFDEKNVEWKMVEVDSYTAEEGYGDKEDDAILSVLFKYGPILANMKKGDRAWKDRKLAQVAEMKKLGISTGKKFREYNIEQAAQQARDKQQARLDEIARQEQREIEAAEEAKRQEEYAARMRKIAEESGRRKDSEAMKKALHQARNWSLEQIDAKIKLIKVQRYKYSDITYSSLMYQWNEVRDRRIAEIEKQNQTEVNEVMAKLKARAEQKRQQEAQREAMREAEEKRVEDIRRAAENQHRIKMAGELLIFQEQNEDAMKMTGPDKNLEAEMVRHFDGEAIAEEERDAMCGTYVWVDGKYVKGGRK